MFLWDGLVLAAWLWDLLRLPRPEQLEVRRTWEKRPCLGVPGSVGVELRNGGKKSVRARLVHQTPAQLRNEAPPFEFGVEARPFPQAAHAGDPPEPGGHGPLPT